MKLSNKSKTVGQKPNTKNKKNKKREQQKLGTLKNLQCYQSTVFHSTAVHPIQAKYYLKNANEQLSDDFQI